MSLHIGHYNYDGCFRKTRSIVTPESCRQEGGLGLTRVKTVVGWGDNCRKLQWRENGCAVKNKSCKYNTRTTAAVLINGEKFRGVNNSVLKRVDVVTLGNLCVDIVLNVPELPPSSLENRYQYMLKLVASDPDKRYWEAGGNCNFGIAAARIGLNCVTLGQVGNEKYGWFLREVLEKEGVTIIGFDENVERLSSNDDETVLCWVLVDPGRHHSFCSRFDFNKEPAFKWINKLSVKAEGVIRESKVLFCNGFLFDELCPGLIASILECARDAGTAIFFDPGPRNQSLLHGTPEQQQTLRRILCMSDVILLTADEVESLTKISNPVLAAQDLLQSGLATKWVIIKLGSRGSLMVTSNGYHYTPAFKVDVADTVGCGDSFASAIVVGYINSMPIMTTLALANAVGAATAMGCGAGRNVATFEKVSKLLLSPKLESNCGDYWKTLLPKEYLCNSEVMLEKKVINGQDNSFCVVDFQNVARDALEFLQKWSQKGELQFEVNA